MRSPLLGEIITVCPLRLFNEDSAKVKHIKLLCHMFSVENV